MKCLDDETATLVVTGGLSERQRAEIDAHVDACEECFALLAALAETITPPEGPEPSGDPAGNDGPRVWKRGASVGRYVLQEQVGAGGMGTVYAAEDPALGRTIAIKLVRRTLRNEAANESLLAEARMMAQLSHPNVVPVYDVGTQEDFVFLAMELIDGMNLRQWLGARTRTPAEVRTVFLEAGRGLVAAHRAGLVHRDFKPDNVLVGHDGRVVVTDFGLAHSTLAPSDRVAGTLRYMAPEQQAGRFADAQSDQFSFAIALEEALTGAGQRASKDKPDPRLPRWLGRIIARATAAEPENRFASMEALLAALARDPARGRRRALAIGAGVLAIAALVALAWRREPHACADAVPAKLAGVWDARRKAEIQHAFASDPEAWRSVENTLDAYAAQWSALHVETCSAPPSSALLDAKVACLGERLAELREATALLARADARIIANAPVAARTLTPVASCGDSRALLAIKPPPPAIAPRVAELRRELARAKALRSAGRLDDAVALLTTVAAACEKTGYEPLEATALLQLGDAELANGAGTEADATLGRAALIADAARDDATRARALTRQLYAAGYVREQFDRVDPLDAQVSSIIARLGGDDELEGDRLQSMGMIALAQHDYAAAADRLARAIALREKTFGPRGRRVAMSRYSHCLALMEESQLETALAECEVALEIWEQTLGAKHPDVSLARKSLGRIEWRLGRIEEGCRSIDEALAIEESTLAPDHPTIAGTLLYLADCRAARGDERGALAADERALAIREAKLGPTHPRTGDALAAVGARYIALHDPDRARPLLDRAHAILDAKR